MRAKDEYEVDVNAAFHQYYVGDRSESFDAVAAAGQGDGILGPAGTVALVATAADSGPVAVTFRVLDVVPIPSGVSAACDVWVPGGVISVMTYDTYVRADHDFGHSQLCRLVVEVEGRDARNLAGMPPERHTVSVTPVRAPSPRWRSLEIDDVGRALAVVTDHVG